MVADFSPWYRARDLMVEAVVKDLQGPSTDEVLHENPLDRYIVGVLHPSGDRKELEDTHDQAEDAVGTGSDAVFDPGVAFAHLRRPASMGLTFAVAAGTAEVVVDIEADRYEPDGDHHALSPGDSDLLHRRELRTRAWRRVAAGCEPVTIDVRRPHRDDKPVADGLRLSSVIRAPRDGVVSVTVVLINSGEKDARDRDPARCWFRPRLTVRAVGGAFVDRRPPRSRRLDRDERSAELLHRRQRHLAVGHGCSVTWQPGDEVDRLETTFFPEHDLLIASAERSDVPALGMATLGRTNSTETLHGLVSAYESWIDARTAEIDRLADDHAETARVHLDEARRAVIRMRAGITLLEQDPRALQAFQVMNQAMQEQRARQELIKSGSLPDDEFHWRPFQLAFILLNLEGLADPESPDRQVADLLWFPTGGGKTEAYLGLIAFTLALRRLGPGDGGGMGVLMRYTLRLLTIQQFERATGLICALERWRREKLPDAAPISIGLWLGQGSTPNDVATAAKVLRRATGDPDAADEGDPRQLLHCPWCGTDLPPSSYDADTQTDRLTVRCSDQLCEFRDGLPVHLVDSDVYRERPSLVIGTVDKFAMLPWQERAGRLFSVDGRYERPDLVIQDELHLISGPLGTLVGLYETAVDHLATGRNRPKLVASTATIRRADQQVKAVFDRTASLFPPPGIDAGDSFFAVDAPPEERGTRHYVGVMAPGASHATLMIRTYAALLQAGQELDVDDKVRDAYWTLLGYFNSLRVLGAAFIQCIDDVPDRIRVLARRTGAECREIREPRELTSRKRSTEIPVELKALSTSYPERRSPDLVLATNMISVGVDVDRLALMVVMGQPQTTAEYIQATSRVGRRFPGLVFTLYNAARSRDLSHYESFTTYHRTLYQQVESAGTTPFAHRALDRALHGVLVSLARHAVPSSASDSSVAVPVDDPALDQMLEAIVARAERVDPDAVETVRQALEGLVESWRTGIQDGVRKYAGWRDPEAALMVPAGGGPFTSGPPDREMSFPVEETPWPTLTSLRNVDRTSSLYLARARRRTRGTQ